MSLLIAILAPGLDQFGVASIGTIVIPGLFLIGGVASYLEAMQLGAEYSAVSTGQLGYQFFRHVFFSRTVLYILLIAAWDICFTSGSRVTTQTSRA